MNDHEDAKSRRWHTRCGVTYAAGSERATLRLDVTLSASEAQEIATAFSNRKRPAAQAVRTALKGLLDEQGSDRRRSTLQGDVPFALRDAFDAARKAARVGTRASVVHDRVKHWVHPGTGKRQERKDGEVRRLPDALAKRGRALIEAARAPESGGLVRTEVPVGKMRTGLKRVLREADLRPGAFLAALMDEFVEAQKAQSGPAQAPD